LPMERLTAYISVVFLDGAPFKCRSYFLPSPSAN
jgi:hypothetical protein